VAVAGVEEAAAVGVVEEVAGVEEAAEVGVVEEVEVEMEVEGRSLAASRRLCR
jgi:hypothetical protein